MASTASQQEFIPLSTTRRQTFVHIDAIEITSTQHPPHSANVCTTPQSRHAQPPTMSTPPSVDHLPTKHSQSRHCTHDKKTAAVPSVRQPQNLQPFFGICQLKSTSLRSFKCVQQNETKSLSTEIPVFDNHADAASLFKGAKSQT